MTFSTAALASGVWVASGTSVLVALIPSPSSTKARTTPPTITSRYVCSDIASGRKLGIGSGLREGRGGERRDRRHQQHQDHQGGGRRRQSGAVARLRGPDGGED